MLRIRGPVILESVQNLLSLHLSCVILVRQRAPSFWLQLRCKLCVARLRLRCRLLCFALHILLLDLTQELARKVHLGVLLLLLLGNRFHENLSPFSRTWLYDCDVVFGPLLLSCLLGVELLLLVKVASRFLRFRLHFFNVLDNWLSVGHRMRQNLVVLHQAKVLR